MMGHTPPLQKILQQLREEFYLGPGFLVHRGGEDVTAGRLGMEEERWLITF